MPTLGQELYDAGWRQGARIPGTVPQAHYPSLTAGVEEGPMPDGMDLVLTTQDCDLVKASTRLPFLEAIGCVDDAEHARSVRANDARFFVLNSEAGTVADRAFGAFLTREALAALSAPGSPCGGDIQRARRFATWLGARYDRPALPTTAVEVVHRPLVSAIRRLCGRGRPHEQLNRDLYEIRVIADLDAGPPFTIDLLIFVMTEAASSEASDFAVAQVLEEAGYAIEGVDSGDDGREPAVTVRRWMAVPPSKLSVALYHQAIPLPLTYESIDGDEFIGAEPLDAESA